MAVIDIQVVKNSTDITSNVIRYNREGSICSSIFTGSLVLADNSNSVDLWDTITFYEYGIKRSKMIVQTKTINENTGEVELSLQDYSKKLSDYLITDIYMTGDVISYSKYWIELFLNEVGLNYSINTSGEGGVISNNTSLGMQMAFDQIMTLLQQSGWYMYFDANGKAIIDDLKTGSSRKYTLDDSKILSIVRNQDDSILRNRAVVWGNGTVYTDVSVKTPWQIDNRDQRAVVLANPYIYSQEDANELAQMMLSEFSVIKDEKVVTYVEDPGIIVGDKVTTKSKAGSYKGIVTDISVSASADGLIYTLVLDRKCPRLFSYFGLGATLSGWVYTGHWGDGIWKKDLLDDTWYDDSDGLENLYIKDLFVRNGILCCVADDGYAYIKDEDDYSWTKYEHPQLRDETGTFYEIEQIRAQACSINELGRVFIAYNLEVEDPSLLPGTALELGQDISTKSWILELDALLYPIEPDKSLLRAHQVIFLAEDEIEINRTNVNDIEAGYDYTIVALSGVYAEGYTSETATDYTATHGSRGYITNSLDIPDTKYVAPEIPVGITYTSLAYSVSGQSVSSPITYNNHVYIFKMGDTIDDYSEIHDVDTTDYSYVVHQFYGPSGWYEEGLQCTHSFLSRLSSTNFVIGLVFNKDLSYGLSQVIKKSHFTVGNSSATATITLFDSESYCVNLYENTGFIVVGQGPVSAIFAENTIYLHLGKSNISSRVSRISARANIVNGFCISSEYTKNHPGMVIDLGDTIALPSPKRVVSGTFGYIPDTYIKDCGIHDALCSSSIDLYLVTGDGLFLLNTYTSPKESMRIVNIGVDFQIGDGNATGYDSSMGFFAVSYSYFDVKCNGLFIPSRINEEFYTDVYKIYAVGGGVSAAVFESFESSTPPARDNLTSTYLSGSLFGSPIYFGGVKDDYSGVYYTDQNLVELADFPVNLYPSRYLGIGNIFYYVDGNTGLFNSYPEGRIIDPGEGFEGYPYVITDNCLAVIVHSIGYYDSVNLYGLGLGTSILTGQSGILKHTTVLQGTPAAIEAQDLTIGTFEYIYNTVATCKVDISLGSPTIVFSVSNDDYLISELAVSTENILGSFARPLVEIPVYSAKSLDITGPTFYPIDSGYLFGEYVQRFVFAGSAMQLLASDYELLEDWVLVTDPLDLISQLETSNLNIPDQYIFYTVKNTTVGVNSSRVFFQRNPSYVFPITSGTPHAEFPLPSDYWHDYSEGLPSSDITVIRVDDNV